MIIYFNLICLEWKYPEWWRMKYTNLSNGLQNKIRQNNTPKILKIWIYCRFCAVHHHFMFVSLFVFFFISSIQLWSRSSDCNVISFRHNSHLKRTCQQTFVQIKRMNFLYLQLLLLVLLTMVVLIKYCPYQIFLRHLLIVSLSIATLHEFWMTATMRY